MTSTPGPVPLPHQSFKCWQTGGALRRKLEAGVWKGRTLTRSLTTGRGRGSGETWQACNDDELVQEIAGGQHMGVKRRRAWKSTHKLWHCVWQFSAHDCGCAEVNVAAAPVMRGFLPFLRGGQDSRGFQRRSSCEFFYVSFYFNEERRIHWEKTLYCVKEGR